MSHLYVCDKCGNVDVVEIAYPNLPGSLPLTVPTLCTQCQGKPWHNLFPLRAYDPKQDLVINRPTGVGLD